jgi:hypothetical protein
VPVFLEKYLLPLATALTVLVVFTNPMNFDWAQRTTAGLAVFFAACFVAHTVHKLNNPPKPITAFESVQREVRAREAELKNTPLKSVSQVPASTEPASPADAQHEDHSGSPKENKLPQEAENRASSHTGDISIGPNSPVTNSTVNTGTINNYGPSKPYILTAEDQGKVREKLLMASARLQLVCIGRGCQSARSLFPAFSGTSWTVSATSIGTLAMAGSDVDLSVGIHVMARDADPSALQSLKAALEVLPVKYELAPWMPIGGTAPDTRLCSATIRTPA